MNFLITIDGPVASGKTSLSRCLASKLGCDWLSTGVFYRGIAYIALQKKFKQESQLLDLIKTAPWRVQLDTKKTRFIYNKKDITDYIYTDKVDIFASTLASFPLVRESLLSYQRDCFKNAKIGLVAEGRDCGTVVFPNAGVKIYLEAKDKIRATRRAQQRDGSVLNNVIHSQKERDKKDINRAKSPLRKHPQAFMINSDNLSLDDMVKKAYEYSRKQFNL